MPLATTAGEDKPSHVHGAEGKTALQAISQGVALPGIPWFTSMEKKRHWILEHMAGAFRVFARKGYTEGMAGHISVRDPEDPGAFWTNSLVKLYPSGGGGILDYLKAGDMILVNEDGVAIGGNKNHPANAAGFLIYSAVHRARPDVHAACHTHSLYGKAWPTFGRPLEMLNQDVCVFHGAEQAVYDDFGGVVLAAALGPKGKGIILRNHRLLTVGGTVDEAAYLFTLMERSCEVQLLVEAAAAGREKRIIEEVEAEYTFKMTSDPESLYCKFRPDYEFEVKMTGGAFKQM
ncbi:arad-like aldolase/epimerase [Choiromyces venosus 120613-1]|uniref:Arad-like aldolase/epimerase n=1 Tax=Choiromyces venosus 120613-1 TaxID=1336337 RepID=A0A3N4JSI8_9PEZI|nr:arad-like aldolase/epimerase [Choiromyces venosus 120613-1]